MSITTHFLGDELLVLPYWRMLSPEAVQVWPNRIWPTSTETFGLLVQELGDARGAGGELHVAFGAVAVELDVGEVDRQAFGGA